jgi:hypothetical protein
MTAADYEKGRHSGAASLIKRIPDHEKLLSG